MYTLVSKEAVKSHTKSLNLKHPKHATKDDGIVMVTTCTYMCTAIECMFEDHSVMYRTKHYKEDFQNTVC